MDREEHIDEARAFVELMIRAKQWDAIERSAVEGWINNFPADLKYYAWRMLPFVLYYSRRDMTALLREAVMHQLFGNPIRLKQLSGGFSQTPIALRHMLKTDIVRTLFVPLTDADQPSESSYEITRIATRGDTGLSSMTFAFAKDLTVSHFNGKNRLVIVDDNLGTGNQFTRFWEKYTVSGVPFKTFVSTLGLPVAFVTLVAIQSSFHKLKNKYPDVSFFAAQLLSDEHRLFAPESECWASPEERIEAQEKLGVHLEQFGIPLRGYRNLDYALIMHETVPNWTAPLFWCTRDGWCPLKARETHDV